MTNDHENAAAGRAVAMAALLGLITPGLSVGADWHLNPRVVLSGSYDDNFRLDDIAADKIKVAGGTIVAGAQLVTDDPTTHFEITPRVRSTLYPGNSEEQGTDYFVDTKFTEHWEKARFSITGDFWRQLVLKTFLPTTDVTGGLGKPTGDTDIGVLTQRNRQDFILLAPEGSYDLGPRLKLEVQSQYIDVKYAEQIAGQRQDFKDFQGGLGLATALTPTSTVTVRGVASEFKPDVGSKANTYGLQGEWTVRQTEVQQAYVRVGVDHTNFDAPEGSFGPAPAPTPTAAAPGSANSFSGGIGIDRKFRTSELFADLLRSVAPNSGGGVVAQDELRLRLEHQIGPRSAAFIGLRGIKESALGSNTSFTNDRYVTGSAGFEWRLTRQFSVTSQYIYTSRTTEGFIATAKSNAIAVSLVYDPHRLAEDAPLLGN
jgi:hypothetical protein